MIKALYFLSILIIGFSQSENLWSYTWSSEDEIKEINYFKVNGYIRFRPEVKNGAEFSTDGDNRFEFVGQKTGISLEAMFWDTMLVKVSVQDSRVWGGQSSSPTGLDTGTEQNSIDLREGFLNLFFWQKRIQMQIGRQKLAYGDMRLVGHLDWTNIGRSFDSVRFAKSAPNLNGNIHGWPSPLPEKPYTWY